MILDDKDGNEVLLSSTGTGLENIGQLVITKDGTITVGLILDYVKKDAAIQGKIDEEYAVYEQMLIGMFPEPTSPLSTVAESVQILRWEKSPMRIS